jgi:hypothetical protein
MRLLPAVALIVGLFVPTGARVDAQSLADAAAREKEKRKAQKPSKIFTEEDLRRAGSSGRASVITGEAAGDATAAEGDGVVEGAEVLPPGEGVSEGSASPSTKKPEKSSADLRAEKQKDWRNRLDKAQADLTAATREVTRIQGIVAGLSPESTSAIANFNTRLAEEQGKAAEARRQVETLETEGRHNGFR